MVDKEGYLWGGSSDFKVYETGTKILMTGQRMPGLGQHLTATIKTGVKVCHSAVKHNYLLTLLKLISVQECVSCETAKFCPV